MISKQRTCEPPRGFTLIELLVENELPPVESKTIGKMDAALVMEALLEVDEIHRAPLMLSL